MKWSIIFVALGAQAGLAGVVLFGIIRGDVPGTLFTFGFGCFIAGWIALSFGGFVAALMTEYEDRVRVQARA